MSCSELQGPTSFKAESEKGAKAWLSLAIALVILLAWALSLSIIFRLDLQALSWSVKVLLLLWQAFLYSGLFVTAHDAMHGVVFPLDREINDRIGTVMLGLYGLFSYSELLKRHTQHHQHPATAADPDYYTGQHSNLWIWYGSFITRYWSWKRFAALVLSFHLMHHFGGVPGLNLAWGWVYPSILSSFHLFFFGTYLPHRKPSLGYTNRHCATTLPRPFLLSLLACYHFGYHHEHHEHPDVPWWKLPQVYRQQSLQRSR
jgi:beta-carotene/zeaxanthin 4-ketolase